MKDTTCLIIKDIGIDSKNQIIKTNNYDIITWDFHSQIENDEILLKVENKEKNIKNYKEKLTICGIFLLIFTLVLIFIFIGWLIQQLLFIEIEQQTPNKPNEPLIIKNIFNKIFQKFNVNLWSNGYF